MTDIEKLRALFDGFGVEYEVKDYEGTTNPSNALFGKDPLVVVRTDEGVGYCGFGADYYFDADGKFVNYGVWE